MYPLNMVIFHSYVTVYQRGVNWVIHPLEKTTPDSPAARWIDLIKLYKVIWFMFTTPWRIAISYYSSTINPSCVVNLCQPITANWPPLWRSELSQSCLCRLERGAIWHHLVWFWSPSMGHSSVLMVNLFWRWSPLCLVTHFNSLVQSPFLFVKCSYDGFPKF